MASTTTNRWLIVIATGFTKQNATHPPLSPPEYLIGFARITQVALGGPGGEQLLHLLHTSYATGPRKDIPSICYSNLPRIWKCPQWQMSTRRLYIKHTLAILAEIYKAHIDCNCRTGHNDDDETLGRQELSWTASMTTKQSDDRNPAGHELSCTVTDHVDDDTI